MILVILMILATAAYRLLSHNWNATLSPENAMWNVAPFGAMALLGGIYFGRKYALWVPLAALAATDLILNRLMGYPLFHLPRLIDYGVFAMIGLVGLWARSRGRGIKVGAAVATPFAFYLISNFGVWLFGLSLANTPYPKTFAGLAECYTAALPFLRGTLIGDWAFMAIFVAVVMLVKNTSQERLGWLVAETKA
ncbi:MAG: DUF6580 family putative transport protein [Verrucomicrobiia bacterium]